MRVLICFSAFLLFFCGCKKDEELIKGQISGRIRSFDQYCYPAPDQPDITVKLYQDTSLMGTAFTNSAGQYIFDNVPYGKYSIQLQKTGYIQARYDNTVYHIGGNSPTLIDFYLNEVPTYELKLDSIRKIQEYIIIFLKFNGDTLLPENSCGMPLRVFAGNTPDVSNENFVACGKAHLSDYAVHDYSNKVTVHAEWEEWEMEPAFEQLKNNIIYIRVYPIATGQGFGIREYYPKALGPPSDVISFRWEEIEAGNQQSVVGDQ
jgi:hypothetical protein